MLEIYPVQDKKEQADISNACNMKYDPDSMCYSATVKGVMVGACQFRIRDKSGLIVEMSNTDGIDDKDALFVMGRAALNFIDLCGVHEAYYTGSLMDEPTLLRIGFRNTDGNWYIDLADFFNHPCEHAQG